MEYGLARDWNLMGHVKHAQSTDHWQHKVRRASLSKTHWTTLHGETLCRLLPVPSQSVGISGIQSRRKPSMTRPDMAESQGASGSSSPGGAHLNSPWHAWVHFLKTEGTNTGKEAPF